MTEVLCSFFATRCKRDLCRHAVSVCPPVCRLSRSYIRSNRNYYTYLHIFSPSDSHTIPVFPYQTSWQYSDGNRPQWGRWMQVGVSRNRKSEPISGFIACCQRCACRALSTRCRRTTRRAWQVVTLIAGSKRRSLLMAGDDEVFMTRSLNVTPKTPKTTEQHLIAHSGLMCSLCN